MGGTEMQFFKLVGRGIRSRERRTGQEADG